MDELGSILREAREAQQLSVEDAQRATRITPKYLTALEEGNYELLPTPLHVKGYLRNYARFLKIDPQPLLDRFEAIQSGTAQAPRRAPDAPATPDAPIRPTHDNPFFNPVNVQINDEDSGPAGDSALRIVIILALIASIGLVASRFLVDDGRSFDVRDAITTLINGDDAPTASDIDYEELAEEAAPTATNSEPIIGTSRNATTTEEEIIGATPVPTPNDIPNMSVLNLRLDVTQRSWLQVTVDGELVFEGQVEGNGPPLEYTAQDSIALKTGNAFGIFATMLRDEGEDFVIGKLGEPAQVYEVIWETSN